MLMNPNYTVQIKLILVIISKYKGKQEEKCENSRRTLFYVPKVNRIKSVTVFSYINKIYSNIAQIIS